MHDRKHFEVLDGLRGIAAIVVLLSHCSHVYFDASGQGARNMFPHGALAVDFFFCLSGFVIAHAYDHRWGRDMSLRIFALRRAIRLHPMIVLGTAIGAAMYSFGAYAGPDFGASLPRMALTIGLALMVLPSPVLPGRYPHTHSLDPPLWSLMQEYIGTIVYAFALRHLATRSLFALAVVAAGLEVMAALRYGHLDVGSRFSEICLAPLRLAFPFTCGLWLHRVLDHLPKIRWSFAPLAALTTLALALPTLPFGGKMANGLLEAGVVILVFPAIVVLGAHSRIGPRTLVICQTLGRLSYPLYVLHYPFVAKFDDYAKYGRPDAASVATIALLMVPAMLALAWAALALWDEPLRRRLSARLLGNHQPVPGDA